MPRGDTKKGTPEDRAMRAAAQVGHKNTECKWMTSKLDTSDFRAVAIDGHQHKRRKNGTGK
jgi:hypothetical protein